MTSRQWIKLATVAAIALLIPRSTRQAPRPVSKDKFSSIKEDGSDQDTLYKENSHKDGLHKDQAEHKLRQ